MKVRTFAPSGAALLYAASLVAVLATLASAARAQVPRAIPFEARLTTALGEPITGSRSVTFTLYLESGAPAGWSETQTVQIGDGSVRTLLGSVTPWPASVNFARGYLLGIQVGNDPEMTPRLPFGAVPYALAMPGIINDGTSNTIQIGEQVNFGNHLRQTLTLWHPDFGIGIQGYTEYFRTGGQFAWFRGGSHHDQALNPGDGGTLQMVLTDAGNLGIGTASPQGRLDVKGESFADYLRVRGGGHNTVLSDGTRSLVVWLGDAAGVDGVFFGSTSNHPIVFQTANAVNHIMLPNGNVGIGTMTPQQRLDVNGITRTHRLQIVGGSDVAEPYHVAPSNGVKPLPGMVVCIDPEQVGQMRVSTQAYDATVAGIISGANGVNPGMTLTQDGTVADGDLPVANVGRVWCYVDAEAGGPVKPGDLLTTSSTPGHAMKADREKSQGAVLGKAMSRLDAGRGLVLVLVGLQ